MFSVTDEILATGGRHGQILGPGSLSVSRWTLSFIYCDAWHEYLFFCQLARNQGGNRTVAPPEIFKNMLGCQVQYRVAIILPPHLKQFCATGFNSGNYHMFVSVKI